MKLLSVVGARPQFIKLAPIVREVRRVNEGRPGALTHVTVHTGQHYDYEMSQVFFDQLGLPSPDYHLGVGSASHGAQVAEMLTGTEDVLLVEKPDVVLVYGDTNSTLAGALTAAKMHVPVAHVEAGLRSYNRGMPEEINRLLVDHASDTLLCPTETAVNNLRREGFRNIANDGRLVEERPPRTAFESPVVINVGDVMYDVLLISLDIAESQSQVMSQLCLQDRGYFLATVHRAESTDNPERLREILVSLAELARQAKVVLPLHPRTRESMSRLVGMPFSTESPPFKMVPPVGYFDMLWLEKHAQAILTDSGGVQKEAFWLGVPCVTLRGETEWTETLDAGWNVLAGPDAKSIVDAALSLERPRGKGAQFFGTGQTARAMVQILG